MFTHRKICQIAVLSRCLINELIIVSAHPKLFSSFFQFLESCNEFIVGLVVEYFVKDEFFPLGTWSVKKLIPFTVGNVVLL